MANPNWNLLRVTLIVLAGFWVYSPALHGDWLWDDDDQITRNAIIHSSTGLWTIWFDPAQLFAYYPLTFSVQWVQWHLWGMETFGYHLTNLFLDILNALLLWRLFSKLGLRLAWLGGLLFVIHPSNVESVLWIVELKNTLSLAPFLLAMCAWIDFEEHRRLRDYALAWGLFLVAMLCKTTVVMFPVVILLYAWWKRGRIDGRTVLATLPFFAISVTVGFATAWLQQHHTIMSADIPLGGFLSRLACAGLSLSFYFSKFVLPLDMMPIYPQWKVNPPTPLQFLPWLVIAVILWALWTRRHGWGRHALLGLGFFFITLAPFLGFKVISYMGFTWVMDHFLYVPMIGLIGLTVALLGNIDQRIPKSFRTAWACLVALAMSSLMLESQAYAKIFVNQEVLWTYALEYNENAWPAHDNLGNVLFSEGHLAEAIQHYQIAIQINSNRVEAHNNLGIALSLTGHTSDAIAQFEQTLKIDPSYAKAHVNLGNTLSAAGRIPEAIDHYQQALKIDPAYTEARDNLEKLQAQNPSR